VISVKLMGGLGNQMFQYALGRKLSISKKRKLYLDISFYNSQADVDTPRSYELEYFKLKAKTIKNITTKKRVPSIINIRPYFPYEYTEKTFSYDGNVFKQPDGTLYIGYWQSEKYFLDIRDELLRDFQLANPLRGRDKDLLDSILAHDSVSLHVRRGDYVNNKNAKNFHGTKGVGYYSEALEIILKKVSNFKLFVFSDDISWCKSNLKDIHADTYFVDGERHGTIDMFLMKNCTHNIIANSSFSWWAAWLNTNPEKLVVAPKKWFNNTLIDTSDIIPNSWIQI
jgi:hypothetical protein